MSYSCTEPAFQYSTTSKPPTMAKQVAFGSDAFGAGCSEPCGFPRDCGSHYPGFRYSAEVLGDCLFQPPYANSKLPIALCQSCEIRIPPDNLPVPSQVMYVPQKEVATPRPKLVYKTPTSCN